MADQITTKPKYKVIKSGIDFNNSDKVLQPKIDGSNSLFELNSDSDNKIYSYRISKRTGSNIDHTNQVPDLKNVAVPNKFDGTVLRGELYAVKNDKPVPAEIIGGMLNAGVAKSLQLQKEKGVLKPYIYDIVRLSGENVENDSYRSKYEMLKRIEAAVPEMRVAETAFTPEQKKLLIDKIKSGRHKDTKEGLVEWDLNKPTGAPAKFKFRDNFEVVIRNINQEVDKYGKGKQQAGSFDYSWTPKGKIVGSVGTGMDRNRKRDIYKNPQDYIGRIARVQSPQKYQTGALRAPSFYSLHIEKNLQ